MTSIDVNFAHRVFALQASIGMSAHAYHSFPLVHYPIPSLSRGNMDKPSPPLAIYIDLG